jgi:hypothetical protein
MEPNKFENYIREQLQKREIKPSARAWEKVSNRLDANEKPKYNRFFWTGIAAGFIGLLMVTTWYFNGMPSKSLPEMKSVTSQEKRSDAQDREINGLRQIEQGKVHEVLVNSENKAPLVKYKGQAKTTLPGRTENTKPEKANADVAFSGSQVALNGAADRIEMKVAEVVARIEVIEKEKAMVMSDAEVDSLLLNAQRELMGEQLFLKTNTINPKTLLANVEEELDQSFRDQIFEKLKSGFEKVRTAVAQRND